MQSNRLKWLAVCAGIGVLALDPSTIGRLSAQATDPSGLPLLGATSLQYLGAFRVPLTTVGGSNFRYTGFGMVYNPAHNSLFVTGNSMDQNTAEIAIPDSVSSSSSVAALPIASVLQPFTDATEGKLGILGTDVKIGGYLIANGRLFMDGYVYYDGSGSQSVSHFSRALDLSSKGSVVGPYTMMAGTYNATGLTSGPMAQIPGPWQSLLGGTAMTEQCCIAVISRTSWGPSFYSWNPSQFAATTPVTGMLSYTEQHPLGVFAQADQLFNGTTQIHGVVFPENSRSVLYFGRQGATYGYGNGVPMNPPSPPVDGYVMNGSNASVSSTGTVITIPYANVAPAQWEWIWLLDQTSPNTDGTHAGVALITAYANSGLANASITLNAAFPANLTNQRFSIGNINLYDPIDPNKGNHGYPYRSQVWAYDASDLLAVRRGTKVAYNLRPYATWTLTPPFNNGSGAVNGAAYDPATGRLFLYYPNVDGTLRDFPIVLVYRIAGGLAAPRDLHVVR